MKLFGIGEEEICPLGFYYSYIAVDGCVVDSKICVLERLRGIDVIQKIYVGFSESGIRVFGRRDSVQVNYARVEIIPTKVEIMLQVLQEKIIRDIDNKGDISAAKTEDVMHDNYMPEMKSKVENVVSSATRNMEKVRVY